MKWSALKNVQIKEGIKLGSEQEEKRWKELGSEIAFILLLILLCLAYSMSKRYIVDFEVTNGTFQNYNVVRRFLAGQIPYQDFTLYLGMGHLLTGSFTTWLFGGSFADSLWAFMFLTMLSFCLLSVAMGKLVLGWKSRVPYGFTMLLLACLVAYSMLGRFGVRIPGPIMEALNQSLTVGNSARYIRGMVCPLLVIGVRAVCSAVGKREMTGKLGAVPAHFWKITASAALCGIAFLWSNDYGIGSWLCATVIFVFWTCITARSWRQAGWDILCWLASCIATMFLLVAVVSRGHVGAWLTATFGVGGYQSWYYGVLREKSYYVWNIDFSLETIALVLFCAYYLWRTWQNRKDKKIAGRFASLAFLSMTAYAVVNEYKLLSSAPLTEVAYAILFLLIVYEIYYLFARLRSGQKRLEKILLWTGVFCGMALSVWGILRANVLRNDKGVYVEALDGYMEHGYDDLKRAFDFAEDEKVFSTYATALETVTGQFQPSGTDYIIHVMGDAARENYMAAFREGNFRYVLTLKESYSEWEYWLRYANWYLYRELYGNYHPVYSNSYHMFWERGGESVCTDGWQVQILPVDNNKTVIRVTADRDFNGVADVLVKYSTEKDGSLSSYFIWSKQVYVENTTSLQMTHHVNDAWTLRGDGEEYLPITLFDGEGEIMLISEPEANTSITVESAACESAYTVMFEYLDIEDAAYMENGICKIRVRDDAKNQIILTGAEKLEIVSGVVVIDGVETQDGFLVLSLGNADVERVNDGLEKSNVCRVVR